MFVVYYANLRRADLIGANLIGA
ncbi:MAG: pentapeptide repeat-containing protein, partial [Intestinibacter sp.]